jgi:hypothetical protein
LFPPDNDASATPLPATPKQKRNTKSVGDLSEVMVIAALVRAGYLVSIPFGENHRYDVIADDGVQLLRIQVKTGRLRGGAINFWCRSSHQHRRSGPRAVRISVKSNISPSSALKTGRSTLSPSPNWWPRRGICAWPRALIGRLGRFGGLPNTCWRSLVVKHNIGNVESVGSIPTASSRY